MIEEEDEFASYSNSDSIQKYHHWKSQIPFEFSIDSVKSFVISDTTALLELQETWIGSPSDEFLWCWYDYFLYIVKENQVLYELRVNLECGHMIGDLGTFSFDGNPFETLTHKESIWVLSTTHDSLREGREFVNSLPGQVILTSKPEWLMYNGEFDVITKSYSVKEFKDDISNRYRNHHYKLRLTGAGPMKQLNFTIYSDSAFWTKFDFGLKEDWKPIKPRKIQHISRDMNLIKDIFDPFLPATAK